MLYQFIIVGLTFLSHLFSDSRFSSTMRQRTEKDRKEGEVKRGDTEEKVRGNKLIMVKRRGHIRNLRRPLKGARGAQSAMRENKLRDGHRVLEAQRRRG